MVATNKNCVSRTRVKPVRLNYLGRDWHLGFDEMPSSVEKLLELKWKSISEDKRRTIHAKFRHLYYMYIVATNHVWLNRIGFFGTKLIDSGLLQHCASELLILHRDDPGTFAELVTNSLIIHLVADVDVILCRIDARKRDGTVIPSHWGLDENSLEAHVATYRLERMRFFEAVRQQGVPCLEVDAAEDMRDNARKVHEFIESQVEQSAGVRSNRVGRRNIDGVW